MDTVIDQPAAPAAAPTPAAPTAAPTAAAPAAPAAAPAAAAPAAPTPAPAPTFESLIHGEPGAPAAAPAPGAAPAAPAAAPAAADPLGELVAGLPEKFQVKAGDGKLDSAASLAKALEHRAHLEQRLGRGELPPKTAAEYQFKPPEALKDFEFTSERYNAFREKALAAGYTQPQFELAMSAFLESVPDLMAGAAKLSANEARAELQKVWPVTADYEANISNAERALRALPVDLQEATREFGTNPAFLRAMAHFGAQAREDTTNTDAGRQAAAADVDALRRSEAYTNPRHPDHARVSKQVKDHFDRLHGTAPVG